MIFDNCTHFFKKGDGGDGCDGESGIYHNHRHRRHARHPKKIELHYIITAPAFQKNAFMNNAPTLAEAVIKMNTAPTRPGAKKGVGAYDCINAKPTAKIAERQKGGIRMTDEEKKLLQAKHRLEEAQARDRVKERKERTRRLI